ncbi:MAG: tetratricopeptide repeat protein [Phycisphaerales bacterium]
MTRTAFRALGIAALAMVINIAGCNTQTRTLPAVRNSGEYALATNDTERAFADFREYTERDPGSAYGHLMLGKTYLAKDMPAHAREQFELAYTNDPRNPDVVESLAEAMYQDKEYDDLMRFLRQRVVERQESSDYLVLGKYSRLTGDSDGALESLLTAAKLDQGRSVRPQLELADFYEAVGKPGEAARRARMAYFIAPDSSRVKQTLARLGVKVNAATPLVPAER